MHVVRPQRHLSGMAAAVIITVNLHYYHNTVTTLFDSFAASSLATLGLTFSLVALVRLGSLAWHNLSQALIRRWHLASSRRGC